MTEKLYEKDSYLKECDAMVTECEIAPNGYAIVLDRTVLFPEGGGQLSDTGTINGAVVTDVQDWKGKIIHHCQASFPVGAKVKVAVNWQVRLDHMQQHCGEHMISYAFWKLFGANNIGFHMSERLVTIDLDKEVTWEQAMQAEDFANGQIWDNRPITVTYKDDTEVAKIPMRKKNEKLKGLLRLVHIEGSDICTCCGTHPAATGSVGLIKITRLEKHKGGTRVEFLCGRWALEDARHKMEWIQAAGHHLSTSEDKVLDAIEKMEGEITSLREQLRAKIAELQEGEIQRLLAAAPVNKAGSKVLLAVEDDYDPKSAKTLLGKLTDIPGSVAGVVYHKGDRVNYLFGLGEGGRGDCKAAVQKANELFQGKGGGKPASAQGGGTYSPDWKEKAETLRTFLQD
jgi:alanyl-tRNA synthetase